ncbi:uncharacterized protein PHALS_14786 [Plasmopara halstedii]|uniref:Uncharacterized protein n=1 Tax=Plasmopara halstedii TaxID=4781 RepID=A0A0P1ASQ7_PLAHL|nr:uncharacterized protein PHALS_14786 [Plasmopara halstedii]CEG45135.1 hypothetical protein PHALS_14786 [Plasmopara halstedii]|eukprot:XP_024581504.1 hypothetical protein PHALS_14786 [Plasmopara halstedii]
MNRFKMLLKLNDSKQWKLGKGATFCKFVLAFGINEQERESIRELVDFESESKDFKDQRSIID